jgi:hypothetical protein
MKKKILSVMMLMIMVLSVGGCYFAVGGYGWDGAHHDHGGYYQGYNGSYHGDGGGYYRDHYRGGWHDRD